MPRPPSKHSFVDGIAVSREGAADLFQISPSTFDIWVRNRWMPEGVKVGALRRWDKLELLACWADLKMKGGQSGGEDGENPFDDTVG